MTNRVVPMEEDADEESNDDDDGDLGDEARPNDDTHVEHQPAPPPQGSDIYQPGVPLFARSSHGRAPQLAHPQHSTRPSYAACPSYDAGPSYGFATGPSYARAYPDYDQHRWYIESSFDEIRQMMVSMATNTAQLTSIVSNLYLTIDPQHKEMH